MAGRTSKYTPERVRVICDAIARSGSDKAGWEAGGISKETFYVWLNEFPDFSDSISAARADWRVTCPETIVRQANKAFADYLFGRMEKVITIRETGTSAKQGAYEREIVTRIPVGVPRWAIERVLGREMNELEALRLLAQADWLPPEILEVTSQQLNELRSRIRGAFEGVLPETPRKQGGLSDETADTIRAQILGLEPTRNDGNTQIRL